MTDDMQKEFILMIQIHLMLGEWKATECGASFGLCALNEPEQGDGSGRVKCLLLGKAHSCGRRTQRQVPSLHAIFSKNPAI